MANAISFYSTAKGYLQGAYLMMSNTARFTELPDDRPVILAFHMQCGFATELYLKSYLLSKGHTEAGLRGAAVRHDLKALLGLVRNTGIETPDAEYLVDLLHDGHKSFAYRYMDESNSYVLSPPKKVFRAFSTLDYLVDVAIGASASRGLEPTRSGWNLPDPLGYWRLPIHPGVQVIETTAETK
jgi:hypothetical protein